MTKRISPAAIVAAAIAFGVSSTAAVLTAAPIPAAAADTVSTHTVQFDKVSFMCGEANESGKVVRFIHATPEAKYLPEYEPDATDPLAKSWGIIYRNICERGAHQPTLAAYVSDKRY